MKTIYICIALSFLSLTSTAQQVPGQQVNSEYNDVWNHIDELWTPAAQDYLRQFNVLLVPGLLSTSAMDKKMSFAEMQQFLSQTGVSYRISQVSPGGDPVANGAVIERDIKSFDGPVLLVTDSKGGIDALSSIINHPELWPNISWLSLRAPYGGTPLVEMIQANFFERFFVDNLFKIFGGTAGTLNSMGLADRSQFNQAHQEQMAAMAEQIPMLSFACWKNPVPGVYDTLLRSTRNQMANAGYENDGLVPWQNEIFPGSDYVAIEGLDHLTPVMNSYLIPFDRSRFSRTVLYMMMTRSGL